MATQALYRRWRSRTFAEIIGQEHVTQTLLNALRAGRVAHAYLFSGPRGTGKTTTARVLAKAVNCLDPQDGEPCNRCMICSSLNEGRSLDLIEIDAASNRGIDEIRELRERIAFSPTESRYKVYVVDEVHMLTNEAFNALLKTLEEPVGKVLFVLLTTNEHLLPATVVSRCQRVELLPLPVTEVGAALVEKWSVDSQKAKLLARLSRGCLGWAVSAISDSSLLKQRAERLDELIEVVNADNERRFAYAAQLAIQFSQNRALVQERLGLWLGWWRDLLLIKTGVNDAITNVDRLVSLIDMSEGYSLVQIKTFINSIMACGEQLKQNANPQLALEVLMLDLSEAKKQTEKITTT